MRSRSRIGSPAQRTRNQRVTGWGGAESVSGAPGGLLLHGTTARPTLDGALRNNLLFGAVRWLIRVKHRWRDLDKCEPRHGIEPKRNHAGQADAESLHREHQRSIQERMPDKTTGEKSQPLRGASPCAARWNGVRSTVPSQNTRRRKRWTLFYSGADNWPV